MFPYITNINIQGTPLQYHKVKLSLLFIDKMRCSSLPIMDVMITSRVEEMVISRILDNYRVLKILKTNSKIIIKC